MPSGRTHDFITIVTGAAGSTAAFNAGLPDFGPTNAVVLLGSYLASGLLFSPDLDLRSAPYRRWRKLRWMWIPYQRMVPHRSWISHSLIIGSLLRILYFALVLSLLTLGVLTLINLLVPIDPSGTMLKIAVSIAAWIQIHPATIAYALAGFVLGGAAHVIADSVVSAFKRWF